MSEFLHLQGYDLLSDGFMEAEIDGKSLFLLREHHMIEQFGMRLGPALKLLDVIGRLRHPPHPS